MYSNSIISAMCTVLTSLSYFYRELENTFNKIKIFQTNQSLLINGYLWQITIYRSQMTIFNSSYTRPVILRDFSLDKNTIQTNIICKINYNNSEIISKPFFNFSNKMLQNVKLIEKQLNNKNTFVFSSYVIETQFRFYYNTSIDKYSCIMDSHTITFSIVILHPLVPGSNTNQPPVAVPAATTTTKRVVTRL
jgi:hypothetical protein